MKALFLTTKAKRFIVAVFGICLGHQILSGRFIIAVAFHQVLILGEKTVHGIVLHISKAAFGIDHIAIIKGNADISSLYLLATYLLDIVFEHYKVVKHPPMDGTVLRLMHNPMLRQEILHSGRKVDVSNVPDVWVMNPEGKEDLFLALSLQCAHCKELFFKIYKAMQKGELKNYRIKIAISPSPQEAKVIEALAATAIHESMEKAMELLATWYETQNRKLFLLSVKKNLPMEGVKKSLEKTNDTVGALGIEGLPFVALDGYEITPTIFWAKVELE